MKLARVSSRTRVGVYSVEVAVVPRIRASDHLTMPDIFCSLMFSVHSSVAPRATRELSFKMQRPGNREAKNHQMQTTNRRRDQARLPSI